LVPEAQSPSATHIAGTRCVCSAVKKKGYAALFGNVLRCPLVCLKKPNHFAHACDISVCASFFVDLSTLRLKIAILPTADCFFTRSLLGQPCGAAHANKPFVALDNSGLDCFLF
jgi:hypothetical protein